MIKGSIQEEDITVLNINAHNTGVPQYLRQTLTDIKGEIDSNIIIVGDFNTPPTPMDRSSKQKINKETQVLNDTLDEMDLIAIFRTFHPNAEEYTFFSTAHGTFSRIDHILGHKSNLSKFKKTEIVSTIFSDHNAMSESEVALLCPTLCDPMDYSLSGSSIHGIFQARVLEWIAISFSRGSSQPRNGTQVSQIGRGTRLNSSHNA